MLVIISGYNQRAVIAFIRKIEEIGVRDYVIIASGEKDSIFLTRYAPKVCYTRKNACLCKTELYDVFGKLKKEHPDEPVVIVPSTEALNRFLVENRAEIEALGLVIPLVPLETYQTISDKRSFWELCQKSGFNVPELIPLSDEFTRKYVAKPRKYISSRGERLIPQIVDNKEKHAAFLKENSLEDFDIQEFVSGESFYLLYYLSRDGVDYKYSQKNLIQQPCGKSIIAAESAEMHRRKIADDYIRMLRSVGFWGFIMIEIRKHRNDLYMIEANPRLWGPTQLFVDAGVPFIEAFLHDCGILDEVRANAEPHKTYYYWSGGLSRKPEDDTECVWLVRNKSEMFDYMDDFNSADIFNRPDTAGLFQAEMNGIKD